ncbi:MAG: HPF/RaiA family ribosome-associated protein [Comamonadaceae bacterium]|nr:HPF/RaiA family ribosome-associated protein [Pseudomonadota bacterium]MBS0608710.1 HPF/RaiA family ribosome-associated protein [Pseudomonadota bacterium]MDE2415882.1 HPF/RaiA family ribosome-associated protein [Comamonadaceae bacterium]
MQVQVHTNDHIQGGESLIQWTQEEVATKLTRFREHVTRVEVFLSDVDAGKSGVADKRCVIEARPAGRQPVAATAEAAKVAEAVAGALDKLVRSLGDDITRAKDRQGRESIRTAE